jgi:hypothetical protein
MISEEYAKDPLWKMLVETVHAMVMYPNHKAYIRDAVLRENSAISPRDLSLRLAIPLGEAIVILYELREEEKRSVEDGEKTK